MADVGYSSNEDALLCAVMENEDRNGRRKIRKIEGYVALTVPGYTDMDFKCHFRLSRQTVQVLLERLAPAYYKQGKLGRPACSLEEKVLMGIWFLANLETFRQVSERFNMARGHAHDLYKSFIKEVCALDDLITWPAGANAIQTLHKFNHLRGRNSFPNVFGCIDGCHIPILGPKDDRGSYYNRKQFTSVLLQGCCDSELRFTNIMAGWPGSSHDARVFRRSELGQAILAHPDQIMPQGSHILGDGAYPLCENLLVPYRNNGHLNERQKLFNKKLSSTRVTIEQAFGHLVGRFRRLKWLEMKNLETSGIVIKAACILHNLCVNKRDETPDIDAHLQFDMPNDNGNAFPGARDKRDRLADELYEAARQQ